MQINKEKITSINNDKVLSVKLLKDSKERKIQKCFLIEGINTIKDIPDNISIVSLFLNDKALKNSDLSIFLKKRNQDYYLVDDKVIAALSDTVTPCGAVAVVKIPEYKDNKPQTDSLILDGISDPGNMGTIIRTAASLGYNDMYCIDCVDFYNNKVVRSTMGGIFRVRLFDVKASEVKSLFNSYELIGLDMDGADIRTFKRNKEKIALIIGSEAKGIREDLIKSADTVLSLPMKNNMESLNASIAAGIVMFILNS